MCELESSIPRCEDAARVLMSCHEDFVKLMELIRMQSSMSSKASLAWEVKKGSNAVKPVVVKALERMAKSPPIPLEKGDQMRPSSPTVETYPRHEKLSLPRKPKRSPSETKLLSEQRLDMVNANKHAIESARLSRIRMAAERMEHVTSRNATSRKKQEDMMWAKLARADRLKQAHLRWIVTKAGTENTKVDEINFIQTLMHQDRKIELQQRLDHVAVRRENLLRQIKDKASLKAESIRAVAKAKEEQLEHRLHEIQKRHEGVQARRLKYQQERKMKRKQKRLLESHASLEASMERTMQQNAQRLRDRMRSLTKHRVKDVTSNTTQLVSNVLSILREIHNCIDHTNDEALNAKLQELTGMIKPHLLGELAHHPCRPLLASLAHIPTLKWVSKATMATALRILFSLAAALRLNVECLLTDNQVLPLVDVLVWALQHWDRNEVLLWALPMVTLCVGQASSPKLQVIREDIVRYIVNVGILFRIADRFALVAVAQYDDLFRLMLHFLAALTSSSPQRRNQIARSITDLRLPLVKIFKVTGLHGILTLLLSSFPVQAFHDSTGVPPPFHTLSCVILHVLNNIAVFDLPWFQAAIGSPTNQPTFLNLVGVVLTNTTTWKNMDDLLAELFRLLGYYALNCPHHQETLRWGDVNVIQRLTCLPFQYFIDARLKDSLFPTLISVCWGDDDNTSLLEMEVNTIMLVVFLKKYVQAAKSNKTRSSPSSIQPIAVDGPDETPPWWHLAQRLPLDVWDEAIQYFESRHDDAET
ncbi:hypothetical protein AC1031_001709 [Aphanomyces cochlioides]|nr:hypothetical protein AC1031_001709 [Aphanomyces cochlioides]